MSLLRRRSISYQDVWGSGEAWEPAGKLTSVEVALGVSAVLSSVDLIASRVQMMSFDEVKTGTDGLDDVVPTGEFLQSPSAVLSPDEWIYQGAASYLLFGMVAGVITSRLRNQFPETVEWLHPDYLIPSKVQGRTRWSYMGVEIPTEDLIIRRWAPMIPGDLRGVAPVKKLSGDLQRAIKAATFERNFFDADGLPIAVLANSEQDIDQPMADAAAARYDAARKSRGRRPLVIGKQWSLIAQKSSASDNSIETTEMRIATKVANVYHVPPEWVGGTAGSSMTYDNPDMNTRLLDGMALQPVYTMLERLISATCLPAPRRLRFRPESILRSDPKAAAEIDERLIRSGIATPNERRLAHGMRPLPAAGDVALWPPYSTSPSRQGGES